jgi:serine/threonine protein kinase
MTLSTSVRSPSAARAVRTSEIVTLGKWQLGRLLGAGQWTYVYEARPQDCPADFPSDYAVKVLKPQHRGNSLAAGCVQREAYVAQAVTHPHLVSILSAHVDRPPFYLVMPRLSGVTLAATLAAQRVPSLPHALWIVRQTAAALLALHDRGWLHADVKPDNIFVSPQGHATLLDLGFAQRAQTARTAPDALLQTTPLYTAPELFLSSSAVGSSSDIYSLGITLYQLLTGRLPFQATDPADIAAAHLQMPPPDPRQFRPQLPPRVARLVKRMLAKEPLRRPSTAELIAWLTELEIETFTERLPAA